MANNIMNSFQLATCNNILKHFCNNAKNVSVITTESGVELQSQLDIEEHWDICLNYLHTQKMIIKVNNIGYELTQEGKRFYRNGGFS